MRFRSRTATTWFLAGLLALISGLGEGLHLIPGCGHPVEFSGVSIWVGSGKPETADCLHQPSPGVGDQSDDSVPYYGEDDCPICRVSGQAQLPAAVIGFCLVLPIAHGMLPTGRQCLQADTVQAFHARAPPIA